MSTAHRPEVTALRSVQADQTPEVLEELWRVAAQMSEDAVFGLDSLGLVTGWTPAATRLFGYDESEVKGLPSTDLVADADRADYHDRVQRVLAGEALDRLPLRGRRRDGLVVPILLTLVPLAGDRGACAIIRDVTEQHVAQATLAESELRLREALRLANTGVWVWDVASNKVQLSGELYRIHGIDPLDFDGQLHSYLCLTHPDDRRDLERDLRRAVAGLAAYEREHRIVHPDGTVRWVYERASLEFGADNLPAGLRGVCQDITERRMAADSLQRQATLLELLRVMAVASNEASDISDALHRCVRDLCSQPGWPVGHAYVVEDGQIVDTDIWHLADGGRYERFRQVTQSSPASGRATLVSQVAASSQPVWLTDLTAEGGFVRGPVAADVGLRAAFGFPVVVDAELVAVVELFSDQKREPDQQFIDAAAHGASQLGRVVERTRAREALARQALHDALTDLPNRLLFHDRLAHAVRSLDRDEGCLAVIFIDLDNFKMINDSLGHDVGDKLLIEVAKRLVRVMRAGDTAARFGGDEFVILCTGLPNEDEIVKVADRLLRAVAEPITLNGELSTVVTGSAGIVISTDLRARPEDLVRDADAAMYRAKEDGGGRFHIFDPALHHRVSTKLELADELRQAVANGELRLVYQPQVRMSDGELIGVEALLRWDNPTRGLLSPLEFIPVAEETQLIVPIGEWILQEACRQAAAWRHLTAGSPGFTMGVNVSAVQLARSELVDAVTRALTDSGISPAGLCMEITESVLMSDASAGLEALIGLKMLGVSIAIDDFGTGYSSLAYLSRFPIDVIKIDRGFILGLGRPSRSAKAIVRTVVDLAHALGALPVAEGVETAEEVLDLEAIGCDAAQGFYFARPQPAEFITALLERSSRNRGTVKFPVTQSN